MEQNEMRSLIDDTWIMPILAIVGSIFSTVAISILLAHYNDQPVFDWNGVTLNAMVAVLSTISKALLAFTLSECLGQAKWIWFSWQQRTLNDVNLIDQGSRGPLGCFKILGQPAARSFIGMGAIIIILSAAIDPFVQLTIGKRDMVRYENNLNVQISCAKRYSMGSFNRVAATSSKELATVFLLCRPLTHHLVKAPDGNTYSLTETDADFGMKSAVFYGLSQPDASISQQTQRFCPYGNCTWDTFRSLAICSACNDLTDRLVTKDMGVRSPLLVSLETTNSGTYEEQVTEYRLPNGLRGDRSTLMTAYGTGDQNESISFASLDTLIWSITMMNFTENEGPSSSVKVSAIECGLWYCVNAYTSEVKGGNLTEIIQPAPSKRNPDSWQPLLEPNSDTIITPPPNTLNYDGRTSSVRRTDLQLGEGFNVSQAAIYSISELMNATFTIPSTEGINAYVLPIHGTTYSPTAMQRLYNSRNLEATFASLAKSMTNNMRQNADGSNVAIGKAGEYLILIRVRPWFLTLPVILTLGGVAFLAIVIYHTHKSRLAVWGTDALPIVGLGGKMGPVFDTKDMRASVMERTAKGQLVQFPASDKRRGPNGDPSLRQRSDYELI